MSADHVRTWVPSRASLTRGALHVGSILLSAYLGILYIMMILYAVIWIATAVQRRHRSQAIAAGALFIILLVGPFGFSAYLLTDLISKTGGDPKGWAAELHEGLTKDDIEDRMLRFADDLEEGKIVAHKVTGLYAYRSWDVRLATWLGVNPWLRWRYADLPEAIEAVDIFPLGDMVRAREFFYLAHEGEGAEDSFSQVSCMFVGNGELIRVVPIRPGFFQNVIGDERYVTIADACRRANTMITTGEIRTVPFEQRGMASHAPSLMAIKDAVRR